MIIVPLASAIRVKVFVNKRLNFGPSAIACLQINVLKFKANRLLFAHALE
jgi:hypothetical protein